jgi:hypothetical protein
MACGCRVAAFAFVDANTGCDPRFAVLLAVAAMLPGEADWSRHPRFPRQPRRAVCLRAIGAYATNTHTHTLIRIKWPSEVLALRQRFEFVLA